MEMQKHAEQQDSDNEVELLIMWSNYPYQNLVYLLPYYVYIDHIASTESVSSFKAQLYYTHVHVHIFIGYLWRMK